MIKQKRPKIGDFIKIDLGNNMVAYARIIVNGMLSFYKIDNPSDDEKQLIEQIRLSKPIFSIYVHKSVIHNDNWKIFANASLEPEILENLPVFFRQDVLDPKICWLITTEPGFKKPITQQDCINMERAAVWDDPDQIEERLKDYFIGRLNIWAERLKVRF